ncbi:divergent polysaccharide deacteylase family protein [Jannaschia aquimarina]|uniref:Divergent polysaccharide deacetylase n=1 Tax=Jannaschia aquimarina TaxID=935700 RepID=A0A0D1EH28_9RHOB|nr:divergent polysaccharide deacteylase family protein [Jannaschia aquimarina]KIT16964.1 Divergent polysaccharide deacetylase [Jannaschia aquimarina]SNT33329.1 Uncharacterized conserved protein YibQ, putative polysaccharide deacetylase 2 family [Jannaschia aquimarina]
MFKGVILGGFCAIVLSGLMLMTVSLIAPPPVRDARLVPDAPQPATLEEQPETSGVEPPPEQVVVEAEGEPATDIDLPAESQFGRPRDDAEPVLRTPSRGGGMATASAPLPAAQAPASPDVSTESAAQPEISVVLPSVTAPVADIDPAGPSAVQESAPATFAIADVGEAPEVPATEDAAAQSDEPARPRPAVEADAPETEVFEVEITEAEGEVLPATDDAPVQPVEGDPAEVAAVADPVPADAPADEAVAQGITSEAADDALVVAEAVDLERFATEVDAIDEAPADTPAVADTAPGSDAAVDADVAEVADLAPAPSADDASDEGAEVAGSAPSAPITIIEAPAPVVVLGAEDQPITRDVRQIETAQAGNGIVLVDPDDVVRAPRAAPSAPEQERETEFVGTPRILTPGEPRRITLSSEEPTEADQAPGPRALTANAAAFSREAGRPLFGIVLVDDGGGSVSTSDLAAFDFPITFALDPTRPGAPEAAERYREAGHEVLLLADVLPEGGTPSDMEVALAAAFQEMPLAVGILDTEERRLSRSRGLLPALAEGGLGLVVRPGGLGSATQNASRAGVPAVQVFRSLDDGDERAPRITRYLDRAAFEAAQDGSALVIGRARGETVTALHAWALGDRAEEVQIAPVSAILIEGSD